MTAPLDTAGLATKPDRIRVAQDSDGFWTCREAVSGSQEYVRADLFNALARELAEARAALRCVQQQCETAVYNITQREHDEAVVRSFQNIADFCARTVLSREASSNE